MQEIGKYLFLIGLGLAAIGGLVWLFGERLSWFGNLPGDIRYEGENFRFYMPLSSMILLSVALSSLIWLIRTFFR